MFLNACNHDILALWGANIDLQFVANEVATVMYVCSYMTKGEKGMGETLRRVAKECHDDHIHTQMNKIKHEFLGKRVLGAPESGMHVLSTWLIKKSRKVVTVNTNIRDECVSLPKTHAQLEQLDEDDENVFATSLIDRYAARPNSLQNMCLATFAVNYDVVSAVHTCDMEEMDTDEGTEEDMYAERQIKNGECGMPERIKLKDGLGYMRKRKQESILRTKRYKAHIKPEKYFHSQLLLYYPWCNEDDIIAGFASYEQSHFMKQETVHANAEHFNEECEVFDMLPEDVENNILQCAWDLAAPNIAQDDAATNQLGFSTVQEQTEETPHLQHTSGQDSNKTAKVDPLSQLYSKAAKKQTMDFQEYCKQIRTLNAKQRHIVMYNRAWCKSYINANQKGEKFQGYRIFLSGPGGTGKSHVVCLIQRDMAYLLNQIIHHDDEQPIVLVTAPTGSAAYQIGGSTIDSALLLYEQGKSKPSWLKHTIMQLKLEHLMLLLTDEISMVGFTKFQCMNQTVCTIKGTSNGNWGDICVLAVGDLYQLPPVGDSPVYMHPGTVCTLDDFAGNGWEKMQLHELSDIMQQKDMSFAECLNNIRTSVPEPGSTEDLMLQQCELKVTPTDDTYPRHAMHVYAQNKYCDDWNENMLAFLSGKQYRYIAQDSKKDDCTEMADVHMSDKPRHTGNMRKILNLKVGARVMLTINIDISDGLTNGAMGTVANIITEEITGEMKTILVEFDNDNVGCEAKYTSLYTNINHNAVPIEKVQVTFPVNRAKQSLQATRKQFPLTLAWAVTIHKCQGLTLPQIVVDMTPTKGTFAAGQAYVAFSRVCTCEKLHIINYTHAQICISPNIELEMQRLRTNMLPEMPQCLFDVNPTALCLLHVNIGTCRQNCLMWQLIAHSKMQMLFHSMKHIYLQMTY